MPKVKVHPEDEERTTLESQWEDEASTTVEQGEVADKIRALGIEPQRPQRNATHITNTGSSSGDELTVDDQQAHLSVTPVALITTRLVITAGNDTGQQLEIDPNKTYTIGRGLDTDFVLTDIAVSRKHFDLRNDDGSWVIVDRGSGNGTVVNGNLEDNPFMLANGDVIEIGNTSFRFDHSGPEIARRAPFEPEAEDEEMSTVAGKPLNQKLIDPPAETPRQPQRPNTLPPPVPLRPRGISQAPAYPMPQPSPAATLPIPAQHRPPMAGPNAPTMLGASPLQLNNMQPTTIPGQGMAPTMMPLQPPGMHPMYGGYPQATEIPPSSVHAQMLVVQAQNRRNDLSTAHVQPMHYGSNGLPAAAPAALLIPPAQLARRTKYLVGGIALTLLAALTTVAVIKASGGKKVSEVGATGSGKPSVTPIVAKHPKEDFLAPDPKPDPKPIAKVDPKPVAKVDPKPDPKPVANVDPGTTIASTDPKPVAKVDPKPDPKPVAKVDPKPDPKPVAKVDPKPDPKPVAKVDPKPDKKPDPKPVAKKDPKPRPDPAPKRVATADNDAVKDRADALYREKKFSDAANLLTAAAKAAEANDARALRLKSQRYSALGRAYNQGMAPGGKATDTFEQLRQASVYDQTVGNAFESEIAAKMGQIAPKAAVQYMSSSKYAEANLAVQAADQVGAGGDSTVKAVRQRLESEAGKLYSAAMKELDGNPAEAKEKFKQIKGIVDAKSPWYAKAQKQLGA